jgi:putative transposon-encoded protein
MKIVKFEEQSELKVKNIKGFMKRKVVVSGTSAKVTCPKEFLGSDAILIILENGIKKEVERTRRKTSKSSSKN